MVRSRPRRRDRQPYQFFDRTHGFGARKGKETHRHHQRLRGVAPDRGLVYAEQRSLCLRHLRPRARNRQCAGQGRKEVVVLSDADYAFGHALEADTSAVVKEMGGESVGSTRYPVETFDQSSFLLQAQSSKAQVVALAGSGNVLVNSIKSAQEFGIQKGGQTLAGLLVWITDVKNLGLEAAP